MQIVCKRCGLRNRETSRFCARCGAPLAPQEAQEPTGESVDLPWLQTVQDRAAKPPTEHLQDQQIASTQTTTSDAQAVDRQAAEAVPSPAAPRPEVETARAEPQAQQQLQPPEGEGTTTQDERGSTRAGAPGESPPQWVVGILEPGGVSPRPEQQYEPEELSHIMPWAHGEEQAEGLDTPGLPPWLGDVTVQETLQSASKEASQKPPSVPDPGLEGIEPFVPPVEEAIQEAATDSVRPSEQVPTWLQAIPGQEPKEEPLRREILRSDTLNEKTVTETFIEPIARNVPVRSPRAGSVETLAALIQPPTGDAIRHPVPDMVLAPRLAAETTQPRSLRQWLLPDGVIYLVILAALLAVLLARPPFGETSVPSALGVQAFFGEIEAVPSNQAVLLAYDYDATRSAEMRMLSEAVVHHLMSRRLRFVTVSTVPQGPGFAQQVTSSIQGAYGYEYGREFLVLGYLPGNEAALASLVSNFERTLPLDYQNSRPLDTYQLVQGGEFNSVSDFALIIVLASEEANLRQWIEQVGVRTGVPIIAATPQSLEPLARPYTDLPVGGLKAAVSGPTGALQYTRQLQLQGRGTPSQGDWTNLTDRLNAQSVSQLLVALVILAALVGLGTRMILRR